MPTYPYLKIDHVDKSFNRGSATTEVLKDVTLGIEKGEFVSIIGHSGCGKSTLLNLVAGLMPVSAGAVLLENKEVNDPGPDRAVVFQNHSLLPWLTVRENVALAVDEVEAGWRAKAVSIGTVVLLLCGLTVVLSLLFGRELRHRAAMQAELARLSLTDALTGLPNRRRFEEAFEAAWDRARRTGKPLSLLVVDADHFKRYNDRYGHPQGDQCLDELFVALPEAGDEAAARRQPGSLGHGDGTHRRRG